MDTETREYFDRLFGEIRDMREHFDRKFDRVEARMDSLEARMDSLEGEVKSLGERTSRLEARFDWLYSAVGDLFESSAGDLAGRLDRLGTRVAGVEEGVGQRRTQVGDMDFRFTQDFLIVEGRLSGIEWRLDQQGLLLLTVELRQLFRQTSASAALN
jgi:chromosome segregation ATPase